MNVVITVGVIILAVNTVVLGALARRRPAVAVSVAETPKPAPPFELSPQLQQQLQQQATATFEAAIQKATGQFGKDLDVTSSRLNALIVKLTTDIVEHELIEYKQGIETARAAAIASLGAMQTETMERQKSLQRDIESELAERRKLLLERVDTRLGEAAVAYIVESLGQAADLGSQRGWLLDSLERHKADLKKDLADEA